MVNFTVKQFKSILIVRKYADNWFWEKYGINGYNGCQHACIYCDSRSAKYHLPEDFGNDIIVKKDVGFMLDKRLTNARTLLPDIVALSGASDPYHGAERKYKNTRQCLEVLLKHKYPVHILTKSPLVERDLDLLDEIGKNTWCSVSVTITNSDKDKSSFLEPNVVSPQRRFNILKNIKSRTRNIQTGVLLMPVIPFFCDDEHNLREMVKQTKESGADYILFGGGMTMRDMQALWFLKHVKEKYPKYISKFEKEYHFHYNPEQYTGSYVISRKLYERINNQLLGHCEKYKLSFRIKRYIPDDYRKFNYLIAERMLNRAYLMQMTGMASKNLFWTGMNIQTLKESVIEMNKRNELNQIRGITAELEDYIQRYINKYHWKGR